LISGIRTPVELHKGGFGRSEALAHFSQV